MDPAAAKRSSLVEGTLQRAGLEVSDDARVLVSDSPVDPPAETAVVVVLDEPDRQAASEALKAGACGVVLFADLETTLVPAVRAVAAGLVVLPRLASGAMRGPVLSARERQVLGLVTMGLTNAEIGQRLFLAESTVKYHLYSLYGKLGVKTRKEATAMVLDPRTGLSLGVMNVTGRERTKGGGYSGPKVV